jgi:uncharacterized protein YwgA
MQVNPRHVVLYAVEQVGDRPNGKTYLQKLCFFVSKLLQQDLGYRAHYYGPYSDQVSGELAFLTGSGFVTENRKGSGFPGTGGWEIARFDYSLTEEGRAAVAELARRFPEEAKTVRGAIERVLEAGDQNYVELSFAAKTSWILENEGEAMTFDAIARAAKRFHWDVKGTDAQRAADFLQKLGLVGVK